MIFPKVSVSLPTYNQENFITEAIDSVLAQDYPNLEVVIGDDASTDMTQQIIKAYKKKFPDLFKLIISAKNVGITANCNKILKECTGDYIATFAGDDLWLPNKLKLQIEYLQNNRDVSLCFTKVDVFDSDTGKTIYITPDENIFSKKGDILSFAASLGSAGCSFVIPRWAIPEEGFEEKIHSVSDWLFWVEVLKKGRPGIVDEVLAKYRRHSNNTSGNPDVLVSEHLLSLCIFEKKYPEMVEPIQNRRAKIISDYLIKNYYKKNNSKFPEMILLECYKRTKITNLIRLFCVDFKRRLSFRFGR